MGKNNGVASFKLFSLLDKNASDHTGTYISCKARFSFNSPHKRLDRSLTARIYQG